MQKKYTAMVRKSKLEYAAVCLELNVSARGVELAAVEKNLPSAIELYLQDIVENKLPGAIISGPKINIEYSMMDSRFLCNISLRGTYILSVWRFELIQLTERSVWRPRVNYNILPEDCIFRSEMALRSGQSVSSFGLISNFVRVTHHLRSGRSLTSFGSLTHFVRVLFLLLFGDLNRRYGRIKSIRFPDGNSENNHLLISCLLGLRFTTSAHGRSSIKNHQVALSRTFSY